MLTRDRIGAVFFLHTGLLFWKRNESKNRISRYPRRKENKKMPVDLLLVALTHQLRCECKGLTWLLRVRGISVRFRRRSLRNGYYVHGQQQARKLSNPNERETVTRYIELAAFLLLVSKWM